MSRPTAISPEEQEQIARRIGVLLLQEAPEDWQQITVEYRATGEYHDLLAEVTSQDGTSRPWEPPEELNGIFGHLREGMYRPDVGTWLSALYTVERPSSYRIDINFDEEPQWSQPLPAEAYVEELNRYPRSEDNIPEWMSARLGRTPETGAAPDERQVPPNTAEHPAPPSPTVSAADPGEESGERPGLIVARVFDDEDEQGRPLVHGRPPLAPQEAEPLRRYLENAPVVLAAEHHTPDRLDPNRSEAIPDSWHSDGSWVWPTAVPYYLSQYGVPPQPELLQHVRSNGFNVADLDPAVREAAEEAARDAEEAEEERELDNDEQRPDQQAQWWEGADDHPTTTTEVVTAAPASDPVPPGAHFDGQPVHGEGAGPYDHPVLEERTNGASVAPVPEPPAEGTPLDSEDSPEPRNDEAGPDDEEQRWETSSPDEVVTATRHDLGDELEEDPAIIFGQFRQRLDELGLDTNDYRLGERSESVWSLFDEAADWVVAPPAGDGEPIRFARPEQACAYLLGSLLLNEPGEQRVAASSQPDLRSTPEPTAPDPREEQRLTDSPSDSEELLPTEEAPSEPSTAPEPEPQRADASPLGDLPRRTPGAEGGSSPSQDGNFLFTATEARPEHDEPGSTPSEENPTPESVPGPADAAPPQPAPEDSPLRTGETPVVEDTPGATPPPGQMPPPLPKRPGSSDQPEQPGPAPQPDTSGQGPAAQPEQPQQPTGPPPGTQPAAGAQPPQTAPGQEGQHPGPVPPGGAPPPPAAPNPQARPQQPGVPGGPMGQPAPGQPGPGQQPGQVPGGYAPGGQPAGGQPQAPPNGQIPGGQPQAGPTGADQPIQPLRGEPPLTLYRNRQNTVLQPGAELDRFGDPDGNVMYAIRTPYNQRSLPPQWAGRNYFAYRVQRPVQVLSGTAVPWFEQPGGGTAYVLPASVNELLGDGTLVALPGDEAPRPPMEG
ncbi:Protein of unknown function [Actinopolyspora xinjiangensis]|uniref:TNT domain-containing protein n=1 Tax=Actinopolyspora xinjiangensis TaxID=405564 RepID=A0A1H0QDE5_9ACTN|nr:TNT domain-containing protein [Actinopolyspora xinjiangensis]SDP14708.1 Protein of unknown function [Actinopolyspora xinjiangensis]